MTEVMLDLGDVAYIGEELANISTAEAAQLVYEALTRNGRPIPTGPTEVADPFAATIRGLWLACADVLPAGFLREWSDRTHESRTRQVSLLPPTRYGHRNDPLHSEAPCGPDGRIGGPPDIALIRRSLFDPHLGLISNLFRDMTSRSIAIVGVEFRYANTSVTSFGRGSTFEQAERVGILEMLERYAMHDVAGEIHRSPHLGAEYLDPRELLRFAVSATEDRVEYNVGDEILWLRGVDYRTGNAAQIPLQAVELGHVSEPRYLFESSSGAALGRSLSEARLFGFLELIERDAFLVFWASRPPLTRIDTATLPPEVRGLIQGAESSRRRIHVFDLTMDVAVPVAMCLIRDDDGPVHAYLSTASHLNPLETVRLAVAEAVVGYEIYATNPLLAEELPLDGVVDDMFGHVRRGAGRAFLSKYEFLNDSDVVSFVEWARRYSVRDEPLTADKILRELIAQLPTSSSVFFADLTGDVGYGHGLYVAKAIVPDLLSMTFGHRHRRIDHARVRRAIVGSHYSATDLSEERLREFDDDPHPFP